MPYTLPTNPLAGKIHFYYKEGNPDGGFWLETSLAELATACFGKPVRIPSIQDALHAHHNGVRDVWSLYLRSVIDGYAPFELNHPEVVEFLSGDLRLLSFYRKIHRNASVWRQFSIDELSSLSKGIRETSTLFQEIQEEIERQRKDTVTRAA